MAKKTEENLSRAFSAESKAAIRNAAFAGKADHEGYNQIGSLFRAVAEAESVHARRALGVQGVAEPAALLTAWGGELLMKKEKLGELTLAIARMPLARLIAERVLAHG